MHPVTPADWPEPPAVEPRPGPQDLSKDSLGDGWSEQLLFHVLAALMPGARRALRRIIDLGGTASYDDVLQYFADHPADPIPISRIGGTMTSIKAAQRRIAPDSTGPLLQRDEQARRYRIDDALVAGLTRAFAMTDARPDLLRGTASRP
ncbi:hypothetical protein K2224_14290 [Streptomyces sp. BHT-5-2]|nr:hypothetical protein K2224_14290 [Streptomyces sp. BHT-5-2]